MHQAGTEPLKELPLAEHDGRLVTDAGREVRQTMDVLA
jgi:hypothetical protein